MSEQTPGYLDVESAQKMSELLGDQLLKHYADRTPQAVEATFKDGDGHVYKGTLYLVKEKAGEP